MKPLSSLFLLLPFFLNSQNLVPNPGFEKINSIVTDWTFDSARDFDNKIENWTSATQGTPDILFENFHTLPNFIRHERPHLNLVGHKSRNGKYFIGMKTYGCLNGALHCKEYIQAQLIRPLQKGKKYYVECWVNPARTSPRVDDFGISFSTERIYEPVKLILDNLQSAVNSDEMLVAAPNTWIRIGDTITAEKDFNFIILGSFTPDEKINVQNSHTELQYSFYLIDDVLVKPLEFSFDSTSFKDGIAVVMENVFFEHNKSTLSDESKEELDFLASTLVSKPGMTLRIIGHTDNTGTDEANLQLSRARAESVVNYLLEKGISKRRLKAVGMGSTQPIADNISPEGRQRNRRVAFVPFFD